MLKKGVPVTFKRPGSRMQLVYESIQRGNTSVVRISIDTRLTQHTVRAAIFNLRTTGQIEKHRNNGKFRYTVGLMPQKEASIFANVSNIFGVTAYEK